MNGINVEQIVGGFLLFMWLWVVGNIVVGVILMVGTVLSAARKFVRYAEEGLMELPPPEKLLKGYEGTEYEIDYQEFKSTLDLWDYRRPMTLLKLLINAPVLFYELLAGRHDVVGYVEYGGYFSRDVEGLAKTLYYGRYLMYRKTRIPKWLERDKENIGKETYDQLWAKCLVFYFYIFYKLGYDKYALMHVQMPDYSREIFDIRKRQRLLDQIHEVKTDPNEVQESLNTQVDNLIQNNAENMKES